MKLIPPKNYLVAALGMAVQGSLLVAQGADGTHSSGATNSNWSVAGNWENSIVADGAGSTAIFDRSVGSGAQTIRLDKNQIIGNIYAKGVPSAMRNVIIADSSPAKGYTVTFNNGSSASKLSNEGWGALTISAAVKLESSLEISNSPSYLGVAVDRFLTLSGGVSAASAGLKTITTMPSATAPTDPNQHRITLNGGIDNGAGTVAIIHNSGNNLNLQDGVNGGVNTFTGGLFINAGKVSVLSGLGNAALGGVSNAITFGSGGTGVLNFSGTITNAANATINRSLTLNGNAKINVSVTEDSQAATTITWSGDISGVGKLTKGTESSDPVNTTLLLTGNNTYSGGTVLTGGGLATGATGNFGTGDLTLEGKVALTLGNANSLISSALLMIDKNAIINLDYNGVMTISGVGLDDSFIGLGLYNAGQLNSYFGSSIFLGDGTISVIPEPGTWMLIGGGTAMLALHGLRRRRLNFAA